jgi:tetratricopeptide (TPR) repeat protein
MGNEENAAPAPVEIAKDGTDDAKGDADALEALDLARGDVNDDDLDTLAQALDLIDFAARRATPERLERLRGLSGRLQDLAEQVAKGIRKRAQDRPPLSPEEEAKYDKLVSEGIDLGEKGEFDVARERLEAAVLLDPDEASGLFNLGVLYGRLAEAAALKGNFYVSHVPDEVYAEKSVFCYERVLELDPKHTAALTNLAAVYDLRGETDLAKDALQRCLAMDPANEKARAHLEDLESSS